MARSTTPRSGTRRSSTTTKKAPTKRAAKAATPATGDTPAATTPAATPAPVKTRAARKPAVRKPAATKAATVPAEAVTTKAPPKAKSPEKPKAPARAKAAAKPASAAKLKTAAKPKAAAKPKTPAKARANATASTRTAKAKAAVTGAAAAVAARLPDVKVPKVKAPDIKLPDLPEVTAKRAAIGAGLLAGIGAAVFLWRSSRADQPGYTVVEQDGDFEIREYPATTTAAAVTRGPRVEASDRNFGVLAAYIYAKSRPGEKLSMTIPVTHTGSASDGWTTRFLMPPGKARSDLPPAPQGVTLETHPPRRVAAVRFSGRWRDDALFGAKEGALRSWLQLKGYPHEAKAEQAAYNSPMMPGPLRRNEVLVTLSEG